MIKVDWLAATVSLGDIGVISVIFSAAIVQFANPSAIRKKGSMPEEMFQTLVANYKKQGIIC
jgi:hypothetical protein